MHGPRIHAEAAADLTGGGLRIPVQVVGPENGCFLWPSASYHIKQPLHNRAGGGVLPGKVRKGPQKFDPVYILF